MKKVKLGKMVKQREKKGRKTNKDERHEKR